jgi:hypothetical protein
MGTFGGSSTSLGSGPKSFSGRVELRLCRFALNARDIFGACEAVSTDFQGDRRTTRPSFLTLPLLYRRKRGGALTPPREASVATVQILKRYTRWATSSSISKGLGMIPLDKGIGPYPDQRAGTPDRPAKLPEKLQWPGRMFYPPGRLGYRSEFPTTLPERPGSHRQMSSLLRSSKSSFGDSFLPE